MNFLYYVLKILAPKAYAFEESTKDPLEAQKRILHEILTRNKDTVYGKEYGFASMEAIDYYQKRVSINNYEDLRSYIDRMAKGEDKVLTSDKPQLFGTTSGTTGEKKLIPITGYSRKKKREVLDLWTYYITQDHPEVLDGKILAITSPEVEGYTESGIPYGTESGHGYKNLHELIRGMYALPYEVLEIKDYEAKYYTILRLALVQNITNLATLNPSTLVLLAQKLDEYKMMLVEDIEKGGLSDFMQVEPEIREVVQKYLGPNPERSSELRDIIHEKCQLYPKDAWPDMAIIECWKGGNVGVYLKNFPEYYGDVPVRDFGYLSSEFRGSIPMTDDGASGVLAINANFYEFIPKDDMGKKKVRVYLCDQLKEGEEYFVVVTTPGGLYRYNIDDIIKVTGFYNRTPLVEFVQKGVNVSSVTGEKLYECQVVEAVDKAAEEKKLPLKHFTACVNTDDGKSFCYAFVTEFDEDLPEDKKKEFLKEIDKRLCLTNCEYDSKRRSQRLKEPVLKVVKNGSFQKFREERVENGTHDGQFKLSRLSTKLNFDKHFDVEEDVKMD